MKYLRKVMLFCAVALAWFGCVPPDVQRVPLEDARYQRAETLFLQGKMSGAERVLSDLLRYNTDARVYLLRGKCLLASGDFTGASSDFKRAVSASQSLRTYIESYRGLGDAYYSAKRYKDSVKAYSMLLQEYPDRIPRDAVMMRYAHSLIRLGEWEQGNRMLKKVESDFRGTAVAEAARDLATSSQGTFYIQLGLFSREKNAENLQRQLFSKGFEPIIIDDSGGYAVIIGYFNRIEDAEESLERLKDLGYRKAFIKP